MSTELRNLSSWELRAFSLGRGPVAEAARRILAEREAASARLAETCQEVRQSRSS